MCVPVGVCLCETISQINDACLNLRKKELLTDEIKGSLNSCSIRLSAQSIVQMGKKPRRSSPFLPFPTLTRAGDVMGDGFGLASE